MTFLIRKYYSGYCEYEIEANNEDDAWGKVETMPPVHEEIIGTLEDWDECNEIELV